MKRIGMLAILAWFCQCSGFAAQQEPLIDLTGYPPPKEEAVLSYFSIEFPSIDHMLGTSHVPGPRSAPPTPKLHVSLIDGVVQEESLIISIRIRNISNEPFPFPISIDPDRRAVTLEQKGRRQMKFQAHFIHPESGERSSIYALMSEGSDAFPDSIIQLRTDETIVVKFKAKVSNVAGSLNQPEAPVRIQVGLTEISLPDSVPNTFKNSLEVLSDNILDRVLSR